MVIPEGYSQEPIEDEEEIIIPRDHLAYYAGHLAAFRDFGHYLEEIDQEPSLPSRIDRHLLDYIDLHHIHAVPERFADGEVSYRIGVFDAVEHIRDILRKTDEA